MVPNRRVNLDSGAATQPESRPVRLGPEKPCRAPAGFRHGVVSIGEQGRADADAADGWIDAEGAEAVVGVVVGAPNSEAHDVVAT